jgi:hypothetical protein
MIAGFLALAAGWGFCHVTIQSDMDRITELAQQSFPRPGGDGASLIAYMQSEDHTLRERNLAVWTLEQLRDPRALPALQAAYTGEPCEHRRFLCQRELKRAIEWCQGTTPNILLTRARRVQQ